MSVLTVAQAKTHLNITAATYDAELQAIIDSAERAIAERCGPLEATSVTDRVPGGDTVLVLRTTPVVGLTSVTPADDADALTVSDLYLDTDAGVVTYDAGSTFTARYYTVVYSAGRASVPADLLMAVKEMVRHLWDTQRGPTRRPGSTASEMTANTIPGAAYLMPFRVSELIAPHLQAGFA